MKKTRDLKQAFENLNGKITDFVELNITEGMERVEIEGIIQQVNRLSEKLEKFMSIARSKY
ncbi:MAG TPA: hypothetical protein VMX55_04325 [candidate division Zixibacteria bacterium]|nr:hypothetical protein [candidate division Zixibacteria bacterium]